MNAALLTDDAAVAALEPAWRGLWRRSPSATPFQSPAWLLPWWRQFGTGHARVAVLWAGTGALAGVLPLYELPEAGRVLPMGAGITDRHDALLAPDAPPGAAGVLLATALAGAALPCDLPDLPDGAALLAAPAPPGWHDTRTEREGAPELAGDIPARQMRKLRMARHRADRAGGYAVARTCAATLAAHLAAFAALHAASWTARGETGVLVDPRVTAFHADAAPRLLAAGALDLRVLTLDGRPAAAVHALRAPGRLMFYLGGWDPARAYESPGTLLMGAMIEEARAEGAVIDFLRGREAYKYAWGAQDRPAFTRTLWPV